MGNAVAAVHADHGVEVRCGVVIEGFAPGAVLIDGGWHEPADVVVVGIGVTPATEWLEGIGPHHLATASSADPDLSTGVPLVYAAGDIVRWHNSLFDEEMRVEHWTNAAEQGAAAATNLLAESLGQRTTPYAPVPFFWSDQYDHRIQFLGRGHADDEVRVVAGSVGRAAVRGALRRRPTPAGRAGHELAAAGDAVPQPAARADHLGGRARPRRDALIS